MDRLRLSDFRKAYSQVRPIGEASEYPVSTAHQSFINPQPTDPGEEARNKARREKSCYQDALGQHTEEARNHTNKADHHWNVAGEWKKMSGVDGANKVIKWHEEAAGLHEKLAGIHHGLAKYNADKLMSIGGPKVVSGSGAKNKGKK